MGLFELVELISFAEDRENKSTGGVSGRRSETVTNLESFKKGPDFVCVLPLFSSAFPTTQS